jgi:ectoine hydroxylase-related dioxygenase (phytanoyl-CoA dioxygenase family)
VGGESFRGEEDILLGFLGLGKFETYQFLYSECTSYPHFEEWIIDLKGHDAVDQAIHSINNWRKDISQKSKTAKPEQILSAEQFEFWNKNGYLRIENVISKEKCEAVIDVIDDELGVRREDKDTWYNGHDKLQGLMLQLYQGAALEAIRFDEAIRKVFACLYDTEDLVCNCEKVSFNPPETEIYQFRGSSLHWDIDFSKGPAYYIQGLVYLNDVPAEKGSLCIIPSFHHKIEDFLSDFDSPYEAIEALRTSDQIVPVEGKQGDLILWHQALPHAATPNHSGEPRYVQYVSFSQL